MTSEKLSLRRLHPHDLLRYNERRLRLKREIVLQIFLENLLPFLCIALALKSERVL